MIVDSKISKACSDFLSLDIPIQIIDSDDIAKNFDHAFPLFPLKNFQQDLIGHPIRSNFWGYFESIEKAIL